MGLESLTSRVFIVLKGSVAKRLPMFLSRGDAMELVSKVSQAIRFIGIGNALRSVRYALKRDTQERRMASEDRYAAALRPGMMQSYQVSPSGARCQFAHAELEIRFLTIDLVRLTWQPGSLPIPYALAKNDWPEIDTQVRKTEAALSVRSAQLEVIVSDEGNVHYLDIEGNQLRNEWPPERKADTWTHLVDMQPEETIYGLGERAAPLNLAKGRFRMWNTDAGGSYGPGADPLYLTVPVYLSCSRLGCTLVFYENSHDGTFSFDHQARIEFKGGALRYYLAVGTPEILMERYTKITGRPPLPPRWALGYHQSRWGYKSEQDIRQVVAGFREHGLPLSAIHLDIDYMDGYRVFTVAKDRFPELYGLARDLTGKELKLVAILDPGVKVDPSYEVFKDGLEAEVYCTLPDGAPIQALVWPGWCVFPDFTRPETRTWWGSYYQRLLAAGISGFWHDMNEPAAFAAWGDLTLPLSTRHSLEGFGGDHRQAHNLYGLLMCKAGFEALREQQPDRRPWILSRSGWSGLQRYAWHWTGDTESSWRALRMTLAMALNLGLSGIPYTGPDIGGFSHTPSTELYTRWFQMAVFLPFFRTHSAVGTSSREPWTFGEPTLTIVRDFLRLRYRLLPYLYTLAWQTSQWGYPLVRPLFWPHAEDPELWDVDDAFLLGDMLLVAPILAEGGRSRLVKLPQGEWYNFWDDSRLEGRDEVEIDAPLERIPVLVAAGSVLPMEENDGLQLHIYPPKDDTGFGQLYSDAGDGFGPSRVDRFRLERRGDELVLSWEKEGDYPFPYTSVEIQLHSAVYLSAKVDGEAVESRGKRLLTGVFDRIHFKIV
jgi:alpha-glucosidase